jgi:hypothetical protein
MVLFRCDLPFTALSNRLPDFCFLLMSSAFVANSVPVVELGSELN